jgi:hypothetical protein
MEPFPSMWNDIPKNRERWPQMQRNDAFLRQQKCAPIGARITMVPIWLQLITLSLCLGVVLTILQTWL